MPLQLAIEEPFNVPAVVRRDPAALDQKVSQRLILYDGPAGASVGELAGIDEVLLHGQDAEEEITVGVGVGHER